MASYKVWLTVRDNYGNLKEVEGGVIKVDLDANAIDEIEKVLPLKDYLKKTDIDFLATDEEVAAKDTLKYSGFFEDTNKGGTN